MESIRLVIKTNGSQYSLGFFQPNVLMSWNPYFKTIIPRTQDKTLSIVFPDEFDDGNALIELKRYIEIKQNDLLSKFEPSRLEFEKVKNHGFAEISAYGRFSRVATPLPGTIQMLYICQFFQDIDVLNHILENPHRARFEVIGCAKLLSQLETKHYEFVLNEVVRQYSSVKSNITFKLTLELFLSGECFGILTGGDKMMAEVLFNSYDRDVLCGMLGVPNKRRKTFMNLKSFQDLQQWFLTL